MRERPTVPGSWRETVRSFSAAAGENIDADRGLWLVLGAVAIIATHLVLLLR